jgi:hypothetical protein
MHKQVQFKTLGMNRDLSESSFNPKFAYENKNIRIVPTDDNTLYSIVNEKGNLDTGITISGTPIGQAIVDDVWVIFTHNDNPLEYEDKDCIYKVTCNDNISSMLLYRGDLNLSLDHPIETLVSVENEKIKKVYWVDGINQTRVINIEATTGEIAGWHNYSDPFAFVKELELKENIKVETKSGGGEFMAGVIQYAFSYYNSHGSESNIFYTSPLKYISNTNRGAETNTKCSCSFSITIENYDVKFDLVSYDCTNVLLTWTQSHMGLNGNIMMRDKLSEMGKLKENATHICHHFSHNGLAGYDDFAPIAAKEGFLVSYDGMEIEF